MTKQDTPTTRDKLLVCGILSAFTSLAIVMGNFSSPGSWSPTIATAAACYLIVVVSAAAVAGIRFLYRDWKTPPRHDLAHPAATLPANLAGPTPTPARAPASSTANCVRKTMSNQYPFSPSEPSSDLSEVSQSPWPQRQYGALI